VIDRRPGASLPEVSLPGVSLAGYLRTESGLGSAARGYARALRRLGVDLALHDLSDLQGNRSQDDSLGPILPNAAKRSEVALVCADVELHYTVMRHLGDDFFRTGYTIGLWAWELPAFPSRWWDRFAFYDEVWVGTSFIANALAPVAPVPVVRIPPQLVPTELGNRARGRSRLSLTDDEWLFAFVFDWHSHMARKNPLAAVQAFARAFDPSEPVRLVLKCVNGSADPEGMAALRAQSRGLNVDVLDAYWPATDVRDLLAACDAYVSLHRAEGIGLTLAEAMAHGKPVIATGWSGNTDFLSPATGYPVAFDIVRLDRGVGPYAAGQSWAEPSIEHAAALMRHVYEDRDDAAGRGARARRDLEHNFGEAATARLIGDRLGAVATRRDLEHFRRTAWAAHVDYQALPTRLRALVMRATPPAARVLVVSRGDEMLLEVEDRLMGHFPQTPSGTYAGYYPADSAAAVRHLDALREDGAAYLVFPDTASWWLEHYTGLRAYLEAGCGLTATETGVGSVYTLADIESTTTGHIEPETEACN
jgi:glycosyltransferase involved in cell wall biosynthesis